MLGFTVSILFEAVLASEIAGLDDVTRHWDVHCDCGRGRMRLTLTQSTTLQQNMYCTCTCTMYLAFKGGRKKGITLNQYIKL